MSDQDLFVTKATLASGDVAYEWNVEDDSIRWGGAVDEIFGAQDLTSVTALESVIDPQDLPFRRKGLTDHFERRADFDCEYRIVKADGSSCWIHDRGRAEFDADGRAERMRGILRVVHQRKEHEERLQRLANFDELTGISNRNHLRDALYQSLVQSQRYDRSGAYLSVGIDKFALLNDAYGYLTADAVIVAASRRLSELSAEDTFIGRVGGDVFGVLMPVATEAEATALAERVLSAFRNHPFETPSGSIHVSVSVGVVCFPSMVQSSFEIMTRGEAAMQNAKRQGRDTYQVYMMTEEQRTFQRRSIAIGEQVKEALKEDRLVLAFQPVVGTPDFEPTFYECLIRMRSRDGSFVPAGVFIPVVEQMGLTRLLDHHVLDLVVQALEQTPGINLAMNISGLTSSDHSWLRKLIRLVERRPDLAERLLIEITETAAIEDIDETGRFVAAVRDLGCRVALDDFGAGYTSFRHLKSLRVDIVKIDGSFVYDICRNRDNRLFVRTLAGLAGGFGLTTVAECVETAEDAAILVDEGIDLLQGYYFARPTVQPPWLDDDADEAAVRRTATTGLAVP